MSDSEGNEEEKTREEKRFANYDRNVRAAVTEEYYKKCQFVVKEKQIEFGGSMQEQLCKKGAVSAEDAKKYWEVNGKAQTMKSLKYRRQNMVQQMKRVCQSK